MSQIRVEFGRSQHIFDILDGFDLRFGRRFRFLPILRLSRPNVFDDLRRGFDEGGQFFLLELKTDGGFEGFQRIQQVVNERLADLVIAEIEKRRAVFRVVVFIKYFLDLVSGKAERHDDVVGRRAVAVVFDRAAVVDVAESVIEIRRLIFLFFLFPPETGKKLLEIFADTGIDRKRNQRVFERAEHLGGIRVFITRMAIEDRFDSVLVADDHRFIVEITDGQELFFLFLFPGRVFLMFARRIRYFDGLVFLR